MGFAVNQPALTSAAIIAALGYTPAISNTVTISNGSAALPGMALAADTSTGFYNAEEGATGSGGGGRAMGWAQYGKLLLTGMYRVDASGGDNVIFRFGTGADIPDFAADTYCATLVPRSATLAGAASTPVGFNIGSWNITGANGVTYTGGHAMIEGDKIDYYVAGNTATTGSNTMTVNESGGYRSRAPVPHRGVTIVKNYSFKAIPPFPVDTGFTTNYYGYWHPSGCNVTATNVYGFYADEAPSGGLMATANGVSMVFNSSIGASAGNITFNARNSGNFTVNARGTTTIDSTLINLQYTGVTMLQIGAGGGAYGLVNGSATAMALRAVGGTSSNTTLNLVSQGTSPIDMYGGGVLGFRVSAVAGATRYVQAIPSNGGNAGFQTNAGDLAISNNVITTGSLTTAAPTTGTAGAWKLGIRVAASVALDTSQYIQLDVGGTLYKLAIVT